MFSKGRGSNEMSPYCTIAEVVCSLCSVWWVIFFVIWICWLNREQILHIYTMWNRSCSSGLCLQLRATSIITWTESARQPPVKQWSSSLSCGNNDRKGPDSVLFAVHTHPGHPENISLWSALARVRLVLFPAEWRVHRGCVDQTSGGYNVSGIMQCSEQVRWVRL